MKYYKQIILVIVILCVGIFAVLSNKKQSGITENTTKLPQKEVIIDKSNWVTYTNTAYGYKINHPKDALLQNIAEMSPEPINKSYNLSIGATPYYITINIFNKQHIDITGLEPSTISPIQQNNRDEKAQALWQDNYQNELKRIPLLDLSSIVKEIHKSQINDPNQNIIKKVGEISEFTIGTQKSYTFTVHESYPGTSKDFPIPTPDHELVYTYTENKNGDKIAIIYTVFDTRGGKISQEILKTFAFTQ